MAYTSLSEKGMHSQRECTENTVSLSVKADTCTGRQAMQKYFHPHSDSTFCHTSFFCHFPLRVWLCVPESGWLHFAYFVLQKSGWNGCEMRFPWFVSQRRGRRWRSCLTWQSKTMCVCMHTYFFHWWGDLDWRVYFKYLKKKNLKMKKGKLVILHCHSG